VTATSTIVSENARDGDADRGVGEGDVIPALVERAERNDPHAVLNFRRSA
jgi:hypothetical protein